MSNYLRRKRFEVIEPHINGQVLDVGCGNADTIGEVINLSTDYVGIERSTEIVVQLKKAFPKATFYNFNLDEDELNIKEAPFDTIILLAVIEHLFNQKWVMHQLIKNLAPNGRIIFTTPTPWGNDIVHKIGARFGLFAKSAVDDHIVIYNKHRFQLLAQEMGMQVVSHSYFQIFCNQVVILKRWD